MAAAAAGRRTPLHPHALHHHPAPSFACRVLPLVSKGMLQASLDADALWSSIQINLLTITPLTAPHLAPWLERRAAAVRCLVLHSRPLPTAADVLSRHLGALAAAVQQCRGLQRLELSLSLAAPLLARIDAQRLPCLRLVAAELDSSSSSGDGSSSRFEQLGAATAALLSLPALAELRLQSGIHVSCGWLQSTCWLLPQSRPGLLSAFPSHSLLRRRRLRPC